MNPIYFVVDQATTTSLGGWVGVLGVGVFLQATCDVVGMGSIPPQAT
jgi:hypothetical protein